MESLGKIAKVEEEKLSKKQVINQLNANEENEYNEDQLKSLLEKSILQKRAKDPHPVVVDTQVQIQGSFEAYDVPARIIEGKIQRQIDSKYLLKCALEWKQRPNGVQPIKSCFDNIELRKYCPLLLIDFYESKIIPKSEIEQQQQQQQQSAVKQKELKEVNNVIQVKQKYEGKYEVRGKGKEIEIESVISISSHESNDEEEEEKNVEKNNGEQIVIASDKPLTIETVSSAQIQRNKLMQQINQQEENENEKQRKKLLEVMKAQNEKQQQQQLQQQEETEVEKYRRQLIAMLKELEGQFGKYQPVQNQQEKESEQKPLIDKIREQSQQQNQAQSESSKKKVEEEKEKQSEKQRQKLLELMNQQEVEMQKENQEIEAELRPSSVLQQLQDLQTEEEYKEQRLNKEIQIESKTQSQENIEIIEETAQVYQDEVSIHSAKDSYNNTAQPNVIDSSQKIGQQPIEANPQEQLGSEVEQEASQVQKESDQVLKKLNKSVNGSNRSVNGTQDELLLSLLNKNVEQVDTTSEISSNKILAMEKALQQQMELEN